MKAHFNKSEIEIQNEVHPVTFNRFYLSSDNFEAFLKAYKTDIDKYIDSKKIGNKFEIKIEKINSEVIIFTAYNETGYFVWKSQEIENTYCKWCNTVLFGSLIIGSLITYFIYF